MDSQWIEKLFSLDSSSLSNQGCYKVNSTSIFNMYVLTTQLCLIFTYMYLLTYYSQCLGSRVILYNESCQGKTQHQLNWS